VREMLRAEGLSCEISTVINGRDFETALRRQNFDLIISDFSLPSFDGLNALALARKLTPHTPFIFFSGTIGEEVAIESLKNGAMDYVLKQRPQRLVAAVRNALRAIEERTRLARMEGELRQIEERLRIIARASNDVIWDWDISTGKVWFSENFETVFGYPREKIGSSLDYWQSLIHPDDRDRVVAGLTAAVAGSGRAWWSEYRVRRIDDSYLNIFDRASLIYGSDRKPRKKSANRRRCSTKRRTPSSFAILIARLFIGTRAPSAFTAGAPMKPSAKTSANCFSMGKFPRKSMKRQKIWMNAANGPAKFPS